MPNNPLNGTAYRRPLVETFDLEESMTDRPNILFVFPDQLSARWLPCYGYRTVKTPVLDSFASQSVRFAKAYTNSPLCTPYRACLFTGQYPSQTGVRENGVRLPFNRPTLSHHLNAAGYGTHYIGKWHLSGAPHGNRWVPPEQRGGFQHFIGWESHHVDHNTGLIWYDDPDSPRELRGHETDGLTDIVCEELEKLEGGQNPFFMTVSYQAPHAPSTPPEADMQRYDNSVVDDPPSTERDSWFKNTGWNADYGVEEFRKRYFGEISHLDSAFGRLLATLEKTGLAENTVVIFTSDHGDMAGCHGLFGKGVMFDESVRVPLLVRLPGAEAHVIENPISTVDLFATILNLAGVNIPSDTEGCSLVPYMNGELDSVRDVFIEYKEDCIIRGDLKLITKRNENDVTHCFNLANDPYELENLSESLDPETRDNLIDSLNRWRNRTRVSTERS
jgi:choline-sulfatase